MKKIYLAILTLITACCIVGGTIYHTTRFGLRLLGWTSLLFDSQSGSGGTNLLEDSLTSGDGTDSIDVTGESIFENISINASALQIKIKTGNKYDVSYSGSDKYMPTAEIDGSTLNITQSDVNYLHNGSSAKLTITLPEDLSLNDVTIYTDVADVELSSLNIDTLTLQTNVGDIDIKSCTIRAAGITSDVGDVDLEKCETEEVTIECHLGDVECKKTTYSSMDITNNMGDVDLEYEKGSSYNITAECDAGSVKVDGQSYGQSYQDTSSGSDAGMISVHANLGSIKLKSF